MNFKYLFYSIIIGVVCIGITETLENHNINEKNKNYISDKLLQIENYLNGLKTLYADFSQENSNGDIQKGHFWLLKRGGATFLKIDLPTKVIIIKNNQVISFDKELKEKSVFKTYSSPVSFLLDKKICLNKNIKILKFMENDKDITLTTCKKVKDDTDGIITIHFSKIPFDLKGWEIFPSKKHFEKHISTKITFNKLDKKSQISAAEFADYD